MVHVLYKGEKYTLKNEKLNLSDLGIDDISEVKGLGDFTELKALDLSFNRITVIEGLESLKKLQILYLNYNLISEIKGLDTLSNLQELYLSSNQILEIKGLKALTKLHTLTLEDNPLPKQLIEKLGGLNEYGYAKNPQKFVEYCKTKISERELIQKILKFEFENKREINELELIRLLKFSVEKAEKFLNLLNSPVDYDESELILIKQKATEAIRKFDNPTLFDLISTLKFDLDIAKKVGKYMINKGWIKEFPRIAKNGKIKSDFKICPYCYSKMKEESQICPVCRSILKSECI